MEKGKALISRLTKKFVAHVEPKVSISMAINLDPSFPDDTYFVSYPRSGSHWFRRLLYTASIPSVKWEEDNPEQLMPDLYIIDHAEVAQYPRPRVMKCHAHYTPNFPRCLYIYRDGRDVCVSYFEFYRKANGYTGTFAEFFDLFLTGHVNLGAWDKHIRGWVCRNHRKPFMAFSYEDLFANTEIVLIRAASFLGITIDNEAAKRAKQECTFDSFQKDVLENVVKNGKGPNYSGNKGGPGKWREVFTEEQDNRFWKVMGSMMTDLGYSR